MFLLIRDIQLGYDNKCTLLELFLLLGTVFVKLGCRYDNLVVLGDVGLKLN